jgi:hypothetical protein
VDYCPRCKGEMAANATRCPHCGYDFPLGDAQDPVRRSGFAYSTLADVALLISMFAAAIGCIVAAIGSIVSLLAGQLVNGLVVGPIAFFLQLGMLVVFLRVQAMGSGVR